MQIEFVNKHKICMIHFPVKEDNYNWMDKVIDRLTVALGPDWEIIVIPNGEPVQGSDNAVMYVMRDSALMMGIAKKFSNAVPGAIIPLDEKEMKAILNPKEFGIVPLPRSANDDEGS